MKPGELSLPNGAGYCASVPGAREDGFYYRGRAGRAREAFSKAEELGLDLDRAMQELQDGGVDRFAESFDAPIAAIEEKRRQFLPVTSR
jgi:hypothetical protein